MKTTAYAGLIASALLAQRAAAGGGGGYSWGSASSFPNPANCNNTCTGDQHSGYNWGGLNTGSFGSFGGMNFNGFTCQDSFSTKSGKRSAKRASNFQSKCVTAKATRDDSSCPSISGQSSDFSVTSFQITVDVDSQLDFEYAMPDGSTCKQSAHCSSEGTTIQNDQCGGASSVRIKGDCSFGIHSMGFDCSPPQSSSTPPPPPPTTSTTTTTSSTPTCAATETLDKGRCVPTTSSTTTTTPVTTTPSTTTPPVTTTTPPVTTTQSTTPPVTTTCASTETLVKGTCVPFTVSTTTPPVTTTPTCASTETLIKGSCSPLTITTPGTTTTTTTPVTCASSETLSGTVCVATSITTTPVYTCASSESLSGTVCVPTITTTTKTCASTETMVSGVCSPLTTTTTTPGPSDIVSTVIVVTTLTTCPVTLTSGSVTSVGTTVTFTTITSTATFCPVCGEKPPTTIGTQPPTTQTTPTFITPTPIPTTTTTTKQSKTTFSTSSSPPGTPIPEAPCPDVLPKCMNTWLSTMSACASNSDTSCFCPSASYISSVQQCVSAWGGDDATVQAALSYLAGICAEFVPQNPGICTGVPTSITLIPTPTPGASTVQIITTVTAGSTATIYKTAPATVTTYTALQPATTITFQQTITLSSKTTVTQTVVTVPQVVFSTQAGLTISGQAQAQTVPVGLIPGVAASTTAAVVGPTGGSAPTRATTAVVATFTGAGNVNAWSVAAAGLGVAAFFL